MTYAEDQAKRAIRGYRDLKLAQDSVKAAGLTVSPTLDSAAAVYASALEQIGLPASEQTALVATGVAGLKSVFAMYAKNPRARQQISLDSADRQAGFAARFPNAAPLRQV